MCTIITALIYIYIIVYNMGFDKGIIFAEYKLPPFRPIRTRFRVLVAHD